MKIHRIIGVLFVSILCLTAVLQIAAPLASAAPDQVSTESCKPGKNGGFLGFPTWYEYLPSQNVAGKCSPVVENPSDALPILVAVVEMLLRIIGVVSVGYVIYGSFRYILSQGQPDATKSARQTIVNAIVGVAISITAASAVSYFGTKLSNASDTSGSGYNTNSQRSQA